MVVLLVLAAAGCGPHVLPKKPPGVTAPSHPPSQQDSLPNEVNSRGITAHWQEQAPNGAVRRVMDIQAATGVLNARTQSGTLNRASGVLYRNDKARARFEAPIVKADREHDSVVALGGVTIRSIDPPGAVVTAHRVTWHAKKDEVIADGDVRMTYRPPGTSEPLAFGNAERMTLNTELDKFHIP